MTERRIQVVADEAALARAGAEIVTDIANRAIERRGMFSVALSRGKVYQAMLETLTSEPFERRNRWERWEIFFANERCVPADDPDSNYAMIRQALLERVAILPENVHRMEGELDREIAA